MKRTKFIIFSVVGIIVVFAALNVYAKTKYNKFLIEWISAQLSARQETIQQDDKLYGDLYAGDELISGDVYDFVVDEDGFIRRINVKGTEDLDGYISSFGQETADVDTLQMEAENLFDQIFEGYRTDGAQLETGRSADQLIYFEVIEKWSEVPTGNKAMIVYAPNGTFVSCVCFRKEGETVLSKDDVIPFETAKGIALIEAEKINGLVEVQINENKSSMNTVHGQVVWQIFVDYLAYYDSEAEKPEPGFLMIRIDALTGEVLQVYRTA